MVRKPYPKSGRKQQLLEQGKSRGSPQQNDIQEKTGKLSNTSIVYDYDTVYTANFLPAYTQPSAAQLAPARFSSLTRMSPYEALARYQDSRGHYSPSSDRGPYSPSSERGGYSSFQIMSSLPLREDVV
ncbi:hypothetical protein DPMN_056901 [Dreissena polymorpha]|uniref:Uncharacterized protein n=1 Tax=Dreissena polymorpha TaxID=45954 RepID=A0A9D4HRX7_DREPO|nr:hypothetical protein DPMN_056901 [Dreissena polymorpha]